MTPEEFDRNLAKDLAKERRRIERPAADVVAAVQRYGTALLKAEKTRSAEKRLEAACRAVLRVVLDREPTEAEVTILYMA